MSGNHCNLPVNQLIAHKGPKKAPVKLVDMSFNSRSRVLSELESLAEIEKKVRRLSLKVEEAVFDDEIEENEVLEDDVLEVVNEEGFFTMI